MKNIEKFWNIISSYLSYQQRILLSLMPASQMTAFQELFAFFPECQRHLIFILSSEVNEMPACMLR